MIMSQSANLPMNRKTGLLGLETFFPLLIVFLSGGTVAVGAAEQLVWTTAKSAGQPYAGSSSCRECHENFYELWATSHHGTAMQPFTPELARSALSEQKKEIVIGTSRYMADLRKGAVIERGPDGERQHPIQHAMGGKNVFYFLTSLDRGRLQVLPVAYDMNRKEWFDTPASAVRHFGMQSDEPLDWRESAFTFNTACFNCHVSQLSKNYDLKTDTYQTKWIEPGINCETCHGPSSEHIRVARAAAKGQPLGDPKLVVTTSFNQEQMNSLCSSCHAKMYPLTSSFPPGEKFFDHFGLVTLENPDFYPDGRDLGENFTETTWRLSPCVKSSQLDCMHCHTSSGRYRFKGENASAACLPCHERNVNDLAGHSRHKAGPESPSCVSCHMPMTEFARMRRSDHSMRPPMPAATLAHGSPNACNICHQDKDAAWADRAVREWHERDYQAPTLQRASLIAAGRKGDWSKLPEMVAYLGSVEREEIWAASLIQLLRACDLDLKWEGIMACLQDSSPLVRAAAVEACGDQLRPDLVEHLLKAARDDYRLVRIRAAGALAPVPLKMLREEDRKSVEFATGEWSAFLMARPDEWSSHYNMGNFQMERREYAAAVESFLTATRLQPRSVPPLVNISLAYNSMGHNEKAEATLRQALQFDPTNAVTQLNLGMLLAEIGKLPEAEKAFRGAFKSDPKSAQAAYNLGVLLAGSQPEEALSWCRRASMLQPREPKYAYTLAFYLAQQGKREEAIVTLEKVLEEKLPHAESYALLGQLFESKNNFREALRVYRQAADTPSFPEQLRHQFRARAQALSPR
jgi:tetratricopeptide (TPR) repeat protein